MSWEAAGLLPLEAVASSCSLACLIVLAIYHVWSQVAQTLESATSASAERSGLPISMTGNSGQASVMLSIVEVMQAKLNRSCLLFLVGCVLAVGGTAAATSPDSGSVEIPLSAIKPHLSAPVVTALAASRDGRFLAAAGDDHVIRLLDVASSRVVGEFAGHTDWIQTLVFSADSKQLYSSGNDGRVLRWEYGRPNSPDEVVRLPFAVRCLSLSTQKQFLAVGGFGEEVGIWNLQTARWHLKFSCSCGDQRCVRFSPAGDRLLCGGRDGHLRVWDTATGAELAHVPLHSRRVHTAAFSTDGNIVTSVSDDRHLVRYDLSAGKVTLDRELKGAKLRSLCLINDYLIAAAGADNAIHIFDVLADEELGKLTGHTGSVAVMCSCADMLVSGSFDTTVRLWKLEPSLRNVRGLTKPVSRAPLEVDQNMEIR